MTERTAMRRVFSGVSYLTPIKRCHRNRCNSFAHIQIFFYLKIDDSLVHNYNTFTHMIHVYIVTDCNTNYQIFYSNEGARVKRNKSKTTTFQETR